MAEDSVNGNRRHERIPYGGPVRISWEEHGLRRFAMAKCIDISEGGMCIESIQRIELGATVELRAQHLQLGGSFTVRYTVQRGARHVIGLQLTTAILLGDRPHRKR